MPLLHVQMPLLYVQMPLLSKPKKTTHLGRSGGPLGGFWAPLGATWTDFGVFSHCKPPSEILESFALQNHDISAKFRPTTSASAMSFSVGRGGGTGRKASKYL